MILCERKPYLSIAQGRLLSGLLLALAASLIAFWPCFAQGQDGERAGESQASSVETARRLLRQIDIARQQITAITDSVGDVTGEELDQVRIEGIEIVDTMSRNTVSLLEIVSGMDESSAVSDSITGAARDHLRFQARLTEGIVARHALRLEQAQRQRQTVLPEDLGRFEARVGENERFLDEWLGRLLEYGWGLEGAGIDSQGLWEWLDALLVERAENLETRLMVAFMEKRRASDLIKASKKLGITPDEGQMFRFHAAEIKADVVVSSLSETADLLEARGLDSAKYRILVIRSTGRITEHVLDWRVLLGLMRGAGQAILTWLKERGPTVLVRIGVVILFAVVFRFIGWLLWSILRLFIRPPKLLADLVARLVRPSFTIIGIATGLWVLGVNPTTLLAGLGVLSVIVGLALQDSLGNLAAGLFILVYKPYDVDEIIQAGGVLGKVKEMGLANTTIITFDNRRFFVPNRKIWGDLIENRSLEKVRRVQATVRVGYDDNIVEVLQHIGEILKGSHLVLDSPAPAIFVSKLDDSWLDVSVWPWTTTENWWTLEMELPLILRKGLAERGIAVPYPRRQVNIASRAWPVSEPGAGLPPTSGSE
jgi:small conductance mechanosensitive channel